MRSTARHWPHGGMHTGQIKTAGYCTSLADMVECLADSRTDGRGVMPVTDRHGGMHTRQIETAVLPAPKYGNTVYEVSKIPYARGENTV